MFLRSQPLSTINVHPVRAQERGFGGGAFFVFFSEREPKARERGRRHRKTGTLISRPQTKNGFLTHARAHTHARARAGACARPLLRTTHASVNIFCEHVHTHAPSSQARCAGHTPVHYHHQRSRHVTTDDRC